MKFNAISQPLTVKIAGQISVRQVQQRRRRWRPNFSSWVLTRLHTRYSKNTLSEDLVFAPAKPVVGGRGSSGASLEPAGAVQSASTNQFQGRYIIRHFWEGEVSCENPRYGQWGGPPRGQMAQRKPKSATGLADVKRGQVNLSNLVRSALPQWNLPGKANPSR